MALSGPWLIQGHGVTIDALDVFCAQLTRDLFAIAKLLLKVLGYYTKGCAVVSRTVTFEDRRFSDKTIPGHTFRRQDVSRTDDSRTIRFSGTIIARMLCISAGYVVASSLSVRHGRRNCRPPFFYNFLMAFVRLLLNCIIRFLIGENKAPGGPVCGPPIGLLLSEARAIKAGAAQR